MKTRPKAKPQVSEVKLKVIKEGETRGLKETLQLQKKDNSYPFYFYLDQNKLRPRLVANRICKKFDKNH